MVRWFSIFLLSALVCTLGLLKIRGATAQEPVFSPSTPPVVDGTTYTGHCHRSPPEDFDGMVREAAALYGINPNILALTVYRESGCDMNALGGAGEIGLTQVHPRVWAKKLQREGVIQEATDLWSPEINLRAGAFILAHNAKRAKEDAWGTLRRYNGAGPKARAYATEQANHYRELWEEEPWVVEIGEGSAY